MALISEKRQNSVERIGRARSLVLYEYYKRNPLEWLRKCVFTVDEHDDHNPVKLYPMRPYVALIVQLFFTEKVLLMPKSRQMTTTWLILALCLYEDQFMGHKRTFLMSKKEDDAIELITKTRFIYTHQPLFLRNLCPLITKLKDQPMNQISWKNGSLTKGLPQGPDQVRSYTVSRLFCDEAAYQDKFEDVYSASQPSLNGGGKLVAISSVNPGYFQKLTGNE